MKKVFGLFLLCVLSLNVYAQDNSAVDELVSDSKNDLMIVLGGGLAGAILGLSTLSFVDEPKDNTKNITTGAALGVVAGVIYVAFNQATKSKDMIYAPVEEEAQLLKPNDFSTLARNSWHQSSHNKNSLNEISPYTVNYNFTF